MKHWIIRADIMTLCKLNRKIRIGKIDAENIISISRDTWSDKLIVYWREKI